jgi:hypothetical protein
MKNRILLIAIPIFFGLTISSCEKNKDETLDSWIKGLWVSETNDSLCFGSFLKFNDSHPYIYEITNDSLKTFPSWSSNLNDWRSCKIETNKINDELQLYNFYGYDSLTLKKENSDCN